MGGPLLGWRLPTPSVQRQSAWLGSKTSPTSCLDAWTNLGCLPERAKRALQLRPTDSRSTTGHPSLVLCCGLRPEEPPAAADDTEPAASGSGMRADRPAPSRASRSLPTENSTGFRGLAYRLYPSNNSHYGSGRFCGIKVRAGCPKGASRTGCIPPSHPLAPGVDPRTEGILPRIHSPLAIRRVAVPLKPHGAQPRQRRGPPVACASGRGARW